MFVAECKCEACERPYPAPSIGPTIDHRICGKCQTEAVVWAAKQAHREVKFNECRWAPRHGREEARIAAENMVTRAVMQYGISAEEARKMSPEKMLTSFSNPAAPVPQGVTDFGKITIDPSPVVVDPSLLNSSNFTINVPAPNNAAEGPRQRMWQLFHQCWGQASDSMRYDRGTWLALEKELLGAKTIREEIVELADRGESKPMMLAPSELRPDLPVNFREFL